MKILCFLLLFCLCPVRAQAADRLRDVGDIARIALPVYALGRSLYEPDYYGALQLGAGVLGTQLISEGLKRVTQKRRPDYKDGHRKDSMPSGHSAAVFSAATFLHRRYGFYEAALPYAVAALTAYSRVRARKHDVYDVTVGALLAGSVTWLITSEYQGKEESLEERENFIFFGYDNGPGLNFRFTF